MNGSDTCRFLLGNWQMFPFQAFGNGQWAARQYIGFRGLRLVWTSSWANTIPLSRSDGYHPGIRDAVQQYWHWALVSYPLTHCFRFCATAQNVFERIDLFCSFCYPHCKGFHFTWLSTQGALGVQSRWQDGGPLNTRSYATVKNRNQQLPAASSCGATSGKAHVQHRYHTVRVRVHTVLFFEFHMQVVKGDIGLSYKRFERPLQCIICDIQISQISDISLYIVLRIPRPSGVVAFRSDLIL